MTLFFPYLLLMLTVLTVAYGTGRLFVGRTAETDEPYFGMLLAMVAGLSILVGIYSAIRTGGTRYYYPCPC